MTSISKDQIWDVNVRPQGRPRTPLGCAKPERGFGFTSSKDKRDALSWEALDALSTDSRTRLIFSPQRAPELIFPFCVHEAKSAMGGTLGYAENQAAVGAATAATLFAELRKLTGAAALLVPPVLMLASMGSTWSIHACFTRAVNGIDEYHIYPLAPLFDLANSIALFNFQIVLSRIRDYALSVIKPWFSEQVAGLVLSEQVAGLVHHYC